MQQKEKRFQRVVRLSCCGSVLHRQELIEAVGPILEGAGLGEAAIDSLCDGIMRAFVGEDERKSANGEAGSRDFIVDLRGIILAYAGRVCIYFFTLSCCFKLYCRQR